MQPQSTYALDALATAAALLLAASHLLRGLDHGLLLALLASTYVAWGAGLRVNLKANWSLSRRPESARTCFPRRPEPS